VNLSLDASFHKTCQTRANAVVKIRIYLVQYFYTKPIQPYFAVLTVIYDLSENEFIVQKLLF